MATRMLSCRVPSMLAKSQLRAAVANGVLSRSLSVSHPNPNIRTGQIPMTVQLPGTSSSEEGKAATLPVSKITTLPNGVKVISESSSSIGCSMGIFLGIGSRFETQANSGSSHFLQHLALKATQQRSHFMLTRAIEKLGGHVAAASSRDCLTVAGECLAKDAEGLFEVLAESALYPKTEDLDIKLASELVLQDLHNLEDPHMAAKSGGAKAIDALHEVAFGGETLGAPFLCHAGVVPSMNGRIIEEFVSSNLSTSRIVISAVGVEHERLVAMAAKAFGDLSGKGSKIAAANYLGGEIRLPSDTMGGEVNVAIGFKGVSCADADLPAAAVLQTLLGGGDSFSAGGPGKGLLSRLFVNVLSEKGVMSATSFNASYEDAGLFGVQGTSAPESAGKMVERIVGELRRLKKDPISAEEATRAVNMTRSALFTNLESKGIVCEDLGRQVLFCGKRQTAQELNDLLTKLTAKDLSRVAGKILSSPVSVAVTGNVGACPPGAQIAAALG